MAIRTCCLPLRSRCLVVPCPTHEVLLHSYCHCPPPVAAVHPTKCIWEQGHAPSVEVSTVHEASRTERLLQTHMSVRNWAYFQSCAAIYSETKKENEPQSCKGWSQFLLYPLQIHSFPKQQKITQLFRSLWQTPIIFISKYWGQIKIFWRFWNVDSLNVPIIKEIKG